MVGSEVSVKVDIVMESLLREVSVACLLNLLLFVSHFTMGAVFLNAFDLSVQVVLKHFNGFDWALHHILCKLGIVLSKFVHVNVKSLFVSDNRLYPFHVFFSVQELLSHFLELEFLSILVDRSRCLFG